PLERGVALLAGGFGRSGGAEVGRLVERELTEGLTIRRGPRANPIVEARDRDPAIAILERGDDRAEDVGGIGDRAAVVARMEIARRALHLDFRVQDPPQRV